MSEPSTTEPSAGSDRDRGEPGYRPERGSVTRGFLFADLRGYTNFVERHGAASAADLLLRYRGIVRSEIDRFDGAEIRTEGDSFYVAFGSVSAAVRCAVAIVTAARTASLERTAETIRVGIGVHAGETVETPDGYVGSPVNIAARLCAMASSGEVLVSDTVRALTQTLLPVRFVPRGRHRLKGVVDPVVVFAVEPIEPMAGYWGGRRRRIGRRQQVAAATAAVLGFALIGWFAMRPAAGLPGDTWTIGVSLPLTSGYPRSAQQVQQAVQLAVDEANAAGGVGGAQIALDVRDDGDEPTLGAAAATDFIYDPSVVGMVGPLFSGMAAEQIPITNAAGLVQCGPSTTDAELTKPEAGALELRSSYPTRINFVRLAAAGDIEAGAAASFAFHDLEARSVLVVDDTEEPGRSVADEFEQAFTDLGGRVVRRALNPGADPVAVLDPLGTGPDAPTLVFFGGFPGTGAAGLRRAMVAEGHGHLHFLGWEGLLSDPEEDAFIRLAGDAAVGSYATRPSVGTVRARFEERYRAAYGAVPQGVLDQYIGAGYACTEIILEALREVAETGPTAENLREAVRAYVVDPAHRFETVLGTVQFDANGDSTRQIVALYRVDPSAAGGAGGEWVLDKQQDFGTAPDTEP
jgi:branched-chain amino acid transport system substrate-binding protein